MEINRKSAKRIALARRIFDGIAGVVMCVYGSVAAWFLMLMECNSYTKYLIPAVIGFVAVLSVAVMSFCLLFSEISSRNVFGIRYACYGIGIGAGVSMSAVVCAIFGLNVEMPIGFTGIPLVIVGISELLVYVEKRTSEISSGYGEKVISANIVQTVITLLVIIVLLIFYIFVYKNYLYLGIISCVCALTLVSVLISFIVKAIKCQVLFGISTLLQCLTLYACTLFFIPIPMSDLTSIYPSECIISCVTGAVFCIAETSMFSFSICSQLKNSNSFKVCA